jgi:hypothetical protein
MIFEKFKPSAEFVIYSCGRNVNPLFSMQLTLCYRLLLPHQSDSM